MQYIVYLQRTSESCSFVLSDNSFWGFTHDNYFLIWHHYDSRQFWKPHTDINETLKNITYIKTEKENTIFSWYTKYVTLKITFTMYVMGYILNAITERTIILSLHSLLELHIFPNPWWAIGTWASFYHLDLIVFDKLDLFQD